VVGQKARPRRAEAHPGIERQAAGLRLSKTRSDSRLQGLAAAFAACIALCGCTPSPGSAFSMESPPLPADPLLASALVGRGDSFDERERIAELNQKRDWSGLLRYAGERQRQDPEGTDWGVIAAYAWVRRGDYPKATAALSRVIQRKPGGHRGLEPARGVPASGRAAGSGGSHPGAREHHRPNLLCDLLPAGRGVSRFQSARPRGRCVSGGRAPGTGFRPRLVRTGRCACSAGGARRSPGCLGTVGKARSGAGGGAQEAPGSQTAASPDP